MKKFTVYTAAFEFNPSKTPNIEEAFWKRFGYENADKVALCDTIEEARAILEKINVHTRVYSSKLACAWIAYIEEGEYEWNEDDSRWEWFDGSDVWIFRVEELTDEEEEEEKDEDE